MRVGVLALQGGYAAHIRALADLGIESCELRTPEQIAAVDGLILPGGESSTQLKLLHRFELAPALHAHMRSGKPVLATCAGLILSAHRVRDPEQDSLGWLDVDVSRNAWGRQVHSFESTADDSDLPLLFIRAPRITWLAEDVEVLARIDGEPIMVRQGAVVGASFHPELTADRRVHRMVFG
jgi:pyridoxal 5'-phosphate synthase pdxT subunit